MGKDGDDEEGLNAWSEKKKKKRMLPRRPGAHVLVHNATNDGP